MIKQFDEFISEANEIKLSDIKGSIAKSMIDGISSKVNETIAEYLQKSFPGIIGEPSRIDFSTVDDVRRLLRNKSCSYGITIYSDTPHNKLRNIDTSFLLFDDSLRVDIKGNVGENFHSYVIAKSACGLDITLVCMDPQKLTEVFS